MAVLEILKDMDDAALRRTLSKAVRGADTLLVRGRLDTPLEGAATAWIKVLHATSVPVFLEAAGSVGERGLALMLLADCFDGDDLRLVPDAQRHPLIAALAVHRLGSLAARRLAVAEDPLAQLLALQRVEGASAVTSELKQAWRAAGELPLEEALDFASLLPAARDHKTEESR